MSLLATQFDCQLCKEFESVCVCALFYVMLVNTIYDMEIFSLQSRNFRAFLESGEKKGGKSRKLHI